MTKVSASVSVMNVAAGYNMTKVQGNDAQGDFSKIFQNQKDEGMEVNTKEVKPKEAEETEMVSENVSEEASVKETVENEPVETQKPQETTKTAETQTGQQATADEQGEELTQDLMNLVMPLLQETVVDVKQMLANELGITQEELGVMLEKLGITELDLLDVGTVKEVLLQVKGVEDMTALLTDEELYTQVQKVETGFEEIMTKVQEALQMPKEEVMVLTEEVKTVLSNTSENSMITMETTKTQTPVVQTEMVQEELHREANPNQEGDSDAFFAQGQQNQNPLQLQNVEAQTTVAHAESFVSVETEQIMNQIMDYMKIQLNADTSSLEMQLQPESLGTLQIRISAKEGIMTAQFTTTSESVRAVLEGQMVQLQQQLENQNIKVDAIEVMVQTHHFESALEQGEERQQAQEGKKNKARKIDLSQMDEMEEISEDDKIVAEMMAANGNTVDYLA